MVIVLRHNEFLNFNNYKSLIWISYKINVRTSSLGIYSRVTVTTQMVNQH